jgi:two-component system sensor histidine kinase DegS
MEAQVDILEGKLKILSRFRESLRRYSAELDRASMGGAVPQHTADKLDTSTPLPPAVSRLVLAAQEDMRREIARAMHDGPAQSLTNIVLQAQIVERLLDRDPPQAKTEIGQLKDMVQHTLDATKTFIFDVRPMVLDDLGWSRRCVAWLAIAAGARRSRSSSSRTERIGGCRWTSRARYSGLSTKRSRAS